MTARLETPHRFVAYPANHAVSAPICVRCGRPKEYAAHVGRRRQIRWVRIFSDRRAWNLYKKGTP